MKWQLAWLCSAALSATWLHVARAQELDAHALAANGDATAEEALGRVTGAFAWDGGLVLRAERTQTVRLAGIELHPLLASPRGFPLSLIPVGVVGHAPHIVGGARVYRTYTPSLPAAFSGGAIDLEPGAIPEVPTLELALGAGLNTRATFQDRWTYEGGDLDWLSVDDGTRALPDSVPRLDVTDPLIDAELRASGDDFTGTWDAEQGSAPPDVAVAARAGDRFTLGVGALGVHAEVHLRNAWRSRDERDDGLEESVHEASLAAALRVRLEYGGGHALESHTWLVRGAEDRVRVAEVGGPVGPGVAQRDTELRWRERQIFTQQLRGEQAFGAATAPSLAWHYAFSLAGDDEPDRREHSLMPEDSQIVLLPPATRRFIERDDRTHDLGVDLRVPLLTGIVQGLHLDAGALAQVSDGEHWQRGFDWFPIGGPEAASVDELFAPDLAGDGWDAEERDSLLYDTSSRVLAGYALLEGDFGGISFQGGARVEDALIKVEPDLRLDLFAPARFDDTHIAPSARLGAALVPAIDIYAAWSLTVDRPRVTELLPFASLEGDRYVFGEPDLKAARQHNLELGAHASFEPAQPLGADGVGASVSHKRIAKPIRRMLSQNGDVSFTNGDHSQLWWLELQADKHFGFIAPWLSDAYASLGVALPLSSSEVLGADDRFSIDSFAALDVPDYVISSRIAYDPARRGGNEGIVLALAHQSVGERATAYSDLAGDETIAAMHLLDFHASYPLGLGFTLGVSARNLIDAPIERRIGGEISSSYRLGRTILLGVRFTEPD